MEELEQVRTRLEKLGYTAKVFANADMVREYLLNTIPAADTVGIGGSMTVQQLGLADALKARGNAVYWHWSVPAEQVKAMRDQAANAQRYLCSVNALLTDGRILNIDGYGNRLAAMLHGTGTVYLIVGKNKIASSYEEGMNRIKNVACPANAKRLGLQTPCAVLGHCTDCSSPQRMCRATLIFDRKPNSHPMEVLLVDEALGY